MQTLQENLFPNISTKEDYVCWLKIIKKLGYLQSDKKVVTVYRKRADSLSAKFFVKFINAFKVYYIYEKYSIIQSLFLL